MAQRVTTAYGPGEVVESIRERGGTKYRVAGDGFSVWLTAAEIPEFGQLQWDETPDKTWDNSTTLPYNPEPQFYGHDGYSTIQPNQHVDSDKRTSPADSVKFNRSGQPARDLSHLFASRREAGELYDDDPYFNGESFGTDITVDPKTVSDIRTLQDMYMDAFDAEGSEGEHTVRIKQELDRRLAYGSRREDLADIQARLGDKYVPIPMEASLDTLQSRLDNDAFRTFNDVKMSNLEQRGELDPRLGQLWDLMDAQQDVRTSAWADVRKKALRLRSSGMVQLEAANPQAIVATVTGDHGIYDVAVIRGNVFTGSSAVTDWTCSCPWGDWAFDRMTYVGRLCSHAYAALLELQSLTKRKDKPYGWSATAAKESGYNEFGYGFPDSDPISWPVGARVEVYGEPGTVERQEGDSVWVRLDDVNYLEEVPSKDVSALRTSSRTAAEQDGYITHWSSGELEADPSLVRTVVVGDFINDDDILGVGKIEVQDIRYRDVNGIQEAVFYGPDERGSGQQLYFKTAGTTSARHPREDGRLSTEPGANRMDTNYIPFDPTHERIDVTAEREAFLSGESDQKDSYSTSQQYVDGYLDENGQHWHEDVDGPGDNPALTNGDDHVLASGHDTRDELLTLPPYAQDLGYLADYYGEESQTVNKALGRGAAIVDHDESGEDVEHLDVEDPDSHTKAATNEDSRAWLLGGGGDNEPGGQFDFTAAAQAHLRTAGRQFTLAEQQALIDEEPVGGPLDQSELRLDGTHYLA